MKSTIAAVAAVMLFAVNSLAQAADTVLILTHEVKDFAVWKPFYDADKPNRDKAGLVERYLIRDVQRPNVVTIVFEAASAEAARAFTANPALKEVMAKAGVLPPPTIAIGHVAK
jgi:hypothetical protein